MEEFPSLFFIENNYYSSKPSSIEKNITLSVIQDNQFLCLCSRRKKELFKKNIVVWKRYISIPFDNMQK
jgi:hypothetical protein